MNPKLHPQESNIHEHATTLVPNPKDSKTTHIDALDATLSNSVSVAPGSEHGEREQAVDSVREKMEKSKQEEVLVREGNENESESDSFSDSGDSDIEGFQLVKDLKVEEKKSIHIKLSTALQADNSQEAAQTATTSVSEVEESYSEHKTVMSADSTVTHLNLKETVLSSDNDDGRRVDEEVGEEEREGSEGSGKERKRKRRREQSSRSDRKKKKHRKQRKRDQNSHSHHRGSSRSSYKSRSRSHSYSRSRSRSRSR